jgi:hypothetical protein
MSTVKLVAVFAENKLGQLARVTQALAEQGINIRWITVATTEKFGVIKMLVDQGDKACQILKIKGLTVSSSDVLAIEVEDQPGGLFSVARVLADNQINVENASGFVSNHRAVLIIETQPIAEARLALERSGLRLLSAAQVMTL